MSEPRVDSKCDRSTGDDFPSYGEIYSSEKIDALCDDHDIPEKCRADFVKTLEITYKTYNHMHHQRDGWRNVARKDDVRALKGHLEKAVKLLRQPGMKVRLSKAETKLWPDEGSCEHDPDHDWIFLSSKAAELLDLVKVAETLDGHKLKGQIKPKEYIIRAALWPALFWRVVLEMPPSLQDRGGIRTRALQFVIDCLDPMVKLENEDGVSTSLFRDFEARSHIGVYTDQFGMACDKYLYRRVIDAVRSKYDTLRIGYTKGTDY